MAKTRSGGKDAGKKESGGKTAGAKTVGKVSGKKVEKKTGKPDTTATAKTAVKRTAAKTSAAKAAASKTAARRGSAKSSPEPTDKLAQQLEKKTAQLKQARAQLKELEAALRDDDDRGAAGPAVSPLAPDAFPELPEIAGVKLSTIAAGVKYADRLDVMLAEVAKGSAMAGVFTRSRTRAAPVLWCEEKLAQHAGARAKGPVAILVNAGNANAFTGSNGRAAVEETALALTKSLGVTLDNIFLASTGVIGEPLPYDRITSRMAELAEALAPGGWEDGARAIMTTDTFPKGASVEVEVEGAPVRIAGLAKGSGMIAPDMATMLVFLFTDADVAPKLLQRTLKELTGPTFNSITVDGDTSTSDTLLLAATGKAGNPALETPRSPGYQAFRRGLERVMRDLAHQVVKDGEGATKFVSVTVEGARTERAARKIALAIANSPLVKTAWAGEDPNWGRLIMAVGKAGEEADRDKLSIRYGEHPVAEAGWRSPDYDEATLAKYMKNAEIEIHVDVGVGGARATVWTCDLTHGYVSINADYRS